MSSINIKNAREGQIAPAHRTAQPGPKDGGNIVFEITNVPRDVGVDQIIETFRKFTAPVGRYKVDYSELVGN